MKRSIFKIQFILFFASIFTFLPAETIHEIQKGETLYSISKTYGTTIQAIQEANGLTNNDVKVGQKIKIPDGQNMTLSNKSDVKPQPVIQTPKTENKPAPKAEADGTYIVQKGETWYGISRNVGISVAELQKLNDADEKTALKAGQKIKIPSSEVVANLPKQAAQAAVTKTEVAKTTTKKEETKTEKKVPDLKANDPHNYSSKKGDTSLVWPVKTGDVTYMNGKVSGVSLAAKKDESVTAIRAGTVMFSGSYRGFGNVVFIQSKTGHIYAYTGLGSIGVTKGDYINFGSQIGTAGIDTYTEKAQVSLMVFQNGQPIDPAKAPRG